MLDASITLSPDGGTTNHVYGLRSIADGKSIRAEAAAPLAEPRTLTVSHVLKDPKNPRSPYRHLVRIDKTKVNDLGVSSTLSMYFVAEIPQTDDFEITADVNTMLSELLAFFTGSSGSRIAPFWNGEP